MAKVISNKLRPPRKRVDKLELAIDKTPFYISLLNQKEIEDFKSAFPNMVDFVDSDGRVRLPVSPDVRLRVVVHTLVVHPIHPPPGRDSQL